MFKLRALFLFFIFALMTSYAFGQLIIPKDPQSNVFRLKCKVNGESLFFIFDTGASNVAMSKKEFNELLKLGKISEKNIIGKVNYTIANGTQEEGLSVIIDTLEIEGLYLRNLQATIVDNDKAPLLLGMNVISQLGEVVINNDKIIINISQEIKRKSKEELTSELNELFENPIKNMLVGLIENKLSQKFYKENSKYFKMPEVDTLCRSKAIDDISLDTNDYAYEESNVKLIRQSVVRIEKYIQDLIKSGYDHDLSSLEMFFYDVYKSFFVRFTVNGDNHALVVNYENDKDGLYIWKFDIGPFEAIVLKYKYRDFKNLLDDNFNAQIVNPNLYTKSKNSTIEREKRYEEFFTTNQFFINQLDITDFMWLSSNCASFVDIYFTYGKLLYDNNKFPKSIIYLSKAIDLENLETKLFNYNKRQILTYRSNAKSMLNDYSGALADLKRIPEVEYDYYLYRRRGDMKSMLNDNIGALQDYNKSISLHKDCYAYLNRGIIKLRIKDKKGACLDWSRAGELGCTDAYKFITDECNPKSK
jgi:clan AA aspartic protease (TIGR02281 family)